ILKKKKDHNDHQDHCNYKRLDNLMNALGNRSSCVKRDGVVNIVWKPGFQIFHRTLNPFRDRKRVRPWSLEYSNYPRRPSVRARDLLVILCTEFDPRDIAEPHDRSIRV